MSRSPTTRLLFWLLLAIFLAAIGWWLVWVPHQPERTFSAIPSSATFLSAHRALEGRWDGLLANPLVRSVLEGAGVSRELIEKWRNDATAQKWAARLGRHQIVFAYVPELGTSREPAWIMSSWMGWRAQSLKWRLLLSRGGLTRGRGRPGQDIWVMRLKDFSPELRVSLTVADGVLLACLSRDPLAVRHVLDVMEKQPWAPSVVTSGILRTAQGLRQDPASTDWGWFLWGAAFRRLPVVFELNQVEARELHGRLSTTAFLRTGNIVEDIDHLKKFLANTPDALLLVSLDALPSPWRSAPIVAETLSLMSTTGAAPRVWAALLGDDWSGRLRGPLERALTPFMKGLKVPTLLVGIETSNSLEMLHRIPVALDNLNRRFGWGVIARWVHLGPFQGLVFEDTRDSFYSQFLIEERVAALAIDGWLVLATNFGGLRRLVQSAPPPPETPASPRYAPLLTASAAGFFWADLSRATAALRGTMGMVSLALLTRQPEQTTAVRRRMAIVSAWLEGLSAFEEAALYAGGGTGTVQQITFVLGPNAAARLIKTFDSMGAPR